MTAAAEGGCVGARLSRAGACDTLVATEEARSFAAPAPLPVALAKALLAEGLDRAIETKRARRRTLFRTRDGAQGRAAFLDTRRPDCTGG